MARRLVSEDLAPGTTSNAASLANSPRVFIPNFASSETAALKWWLGTSFLVHLQDFERERNFVANLGDFLGHVLARASFLRKGTNCGEAGPAIEVARKDYANAVKRGLSLAEANAFVLAAEMVTGSHRLEFVNSADGTRNRAILVVPENVWERGRDRKDLLLAGGAYSIILQRPPTPEEASSIEKFITSLRSSEGKLPGDWLVSVYRKVAENHAGFFETNVEKLRSSSEAPKRVCIADDDSEVRAFRAIFRGEELVDLCTAGCFNYSSAQTRLKQAMEHFRWIRAHLRTSPELANKYAQLSSLAAQGVGSTTSSKVAPEEELRRHACVHQLSREAERNVGNQMATRGLLGSVMCAWWQDECRMYEATIVYVAEDKDEGIFQAYRSLEVSLD